MRGLLDAVDESPVGHLEDERLAALETVDRPERREVGRRWPATATVPAGPEGAVRVVIGPFRSAEVSTPSTVTNERPSVSIEIRPRGFCGR